MAKNRVNQQRKRAAFVQPLAKGAEVNQEDVKNEDLQVSLGDYDPKDDVKELVESATDAEDEPEDAVDMAESTEDAGTKEAEADLAKTLEALAALKDATPAVEPVAEKPAKVLSPRLVHIQAALDNYASAMGPGVRQTPETLRTQQNALFFAIVSAATAGDQSREALDLVYRAFRKGGAFHPRYVYRGVIEMGNADEGSSRRNGIRYAALLGIIERTLNPATREEQLAHVDLDPFIRDIADETITSALLGYLGM